MQWTEPLLLEHEFARDGSRRRVRVRLGFPRLVDAHEWACAFQVSGWRGGKVLIARGVDGLQALIIAVSAIRTRLGRMKNIRRDQQPYEFVFPKVVPMAHGLDYHRHLCNVLDAEINKKEEEIADRHRARRRSR